MKRTHQKASVAGKQQFVVMFRGKMLVSEISASTPGTVYRYAVDGTVRNLLASVAALVAEVI